MMCSSSLYKWIPFSSSGIPEKTPLLWMGLTISKLYFMPRSKSSTPCAGAICTHPVPESSVTWSLSIIFILLSKNGCLASKLTNFSPLHLAILFKSNSTLSLNFSKRFSAIIKFSFPFVIKI